MSLTRRSFIKHTVGASAWATCLPLMSRMPVLAGQAPHDRVLVLLQLTGGNDGLNTVVPYGNDVYARSRPTLRLRSGDLHIIDDTLAFHPRMGAFHRLFREGRLSVVQGVGCPNLSNDHEAAMRVWHTAAPGGHHHTGWLGRTADWLRSSDPAGVPAAFVSSIKRPFVLCSEEALIPRIASLDAAVLSAPMSRARDHQPDDALLAYVRSAGRRSRTLSQRIQSVSHSASDYPSFTLAQHLRTIAQLIRADVGIRVFFTELGGDGFGGFDNHANQLGNHCALLHQLSESVGAFVRDLQQQNLLDRVLLMTYSEFGRTVKENGRRGTGHGAAAPVFLAGGRLKGGLIGRHPSLIDLHNGSLKHHTDFRQLYATALDTWLGVDSRAVLEKDYERIDMLDGTV